MLMCFGWWAKPLCNNPVSREDALCVECQRGFDEFREAMNAAAGPLSPVPGQENT